MCVIAIADKTRPTPDMIERMFNSNPSGGGVGWREGGFVHWAKGLTLPEMQVRIANMPLPFIAHFRIPTCGGTNPLLCHPFIVHPNSPLELVGKTSGNILFHNGHWTDWKATLIRGFGTHKIKLPKGVWSDSRALAVLAAVRGLEVLELVDERVVVFGPNEEDVRMFGGIWTRVNDVVVSNTHWQGYNHVHTHFEPTMCREQRCSQKRHANSPWCEEHQSLDPANKTPDSRSLTADLAALCMRCHKSVSCKCPEGKLLFSTTKTGGSSADTTFCGRLRTPAEGEAVAPQVQEGAPSVRLAPEERTVAVAEGEEPESPSALISWTRRLNPKILRGHTPVTTALQTRLDARTRGIEHVGPI